MLEALFGNKTVQKVLIFLFVNGKCYGTQLQRQLKCSLTPVQKALLRLEKGGIISCYYEGKTRVYQFNGNFAFYDELEPLLKKAYSLLPVHEKREYYVPKKEHELAKMAPREMKQLLINFWKRLTDVNQLTFHASTKSKENTGWNASGKGSVTLTKQTQSVTITHEKGVWQGKGGSEMGFSNVFRWTLDLHQHMISLEHLRRGPDHPIFLFNLMPTGPLSLASIDSHLCEKDSYFGQVFLDPHTIRLHWRVVGPKKNEEITFTYFLSSIVKG